MRITNQQKKELSDIFIQNNLNFLDFEVNGNYQEFNLKFKFDYFSFSVIRKELEEYVITVCSVDNTRKGSSVVKWDAVLIRFRQWTKQIETELNTPTGWELLKAKII